MQTRNPSSSYQQLPSSPSKITEKGRTSLTSPGLPPPPNIAKQAKGVQSGYSENLARSMTIDEMRQLHRHALNEAEAKQTELRLVLASRYRELVGSSDEVTKMRERAQELNELIHAIPELMEKLISTKVSEASEQLPDGGAKTRAESNFASAKENEENLRVRHSLANLPRLIYRALDRNDVYEAAVFLMDVFHTIAEQTNEYPLANTLNQVPRQMHRSQNLSSLVLPVVDKRFQAQIRMTFLHLQTLPAKIARISKRILCCSSSSGSDIDSKFGASMSASALSTLDLLDIRENRDRPVELLDLYFDCKAQLLQRLLNELTTSIGTNTNEEEASGANRASTAEQILSKIVLILQYDVILHPYQIFVLRQFFSPPSSTSISTPAVVMNSLPIFPVSMVQSRVTNFLSAHLPLIRTKVKSVLIEIAGTTASALGKIRQSLYDKTDGADSMLRLDSTGVCTWEEAVHSIVDVQSVLSSSHGANSPTTYSQDDRKSGKDRRFSLWSVLFSSTFSSLVNSLLTTSFHSVHSKVVSTLRLSLANAPKLAAMLPHEAYRNALYIASELDAALLRVSDDAHELLVHAEERVESERRLRQSLYVQTCEIMGRLICELRRMLHTADRNDAVRELIVGRLCHLLKFRLTALPTLLNPESSPSVLQSTSGMISLLELSSAFDLADDDDDGLITFQEALQAVDSAFSGTQFHGAEMVRETLLLALPSSRDQSTLGTQGARVSTPQDVTLNELILLLARGLCHEKSGQHSALGTIQESLDQIIGICFDRWAEEALQHVTNTFSFSVQRFVETASNYSESEFKRIYAHSLEPNSLVATDKAVVGNVSPHILSYIQGLSFALNHAVCPSDSLVPVPSSGYARSLGIDGKNISCLLDVFRWSLLSKGLSTAVAVLDEYVTLGIDENKSSFRQCGPTGLVQLKSDLSFLGKCFFKRNKYGFGRSVGEEKSERKLRALSKEVDGLVRRNCEKSILGKIEERHNHITEVCDLYLGSLLGQDETLAVPLGDVAAIQQTGSNHLFHAPLRSTCRFSLLTIQSDRSLSGVQARGKMKEKEENESQQESAGSGAMRAGLGFFSSMLKKN